MRYRHELKFICSDQRLFLLENKIKNLCRSDSYAGQKGNYVVRSLYFDTCYDKCLMEGQAGTDNRRKYRIRIYNGNDEVIKLECKRSFRGMKAKEACRITRTQCESLMHGAPIGDTEADQELLRRFLCEKSMEFLEPKVIVEYVRAPYVYAFGNVRITFDRNIGSSVEVERFLEKDILRKGILPPGEQLLEVKYDEILPGTILEILAGGQQLSRTSFSKYVLCRQYGIKYV